MKLKELLLTTALSTVTLFGSFQNISCTPTDDYLETLQITEGDCLALEAIWDNMGHENWTNELTNNQPWDRNISAENWFGVYLHDEGGVLSIAIQDNNLTGQLPTGLNFFTSILGLGITGNRLTGHLPSLTQPNTLTHIFLFNNNLTGSIPESWSNLQVLKYIAVDGNHLSGALPNLSNLNNFTTLNIDFNDFTFNDIEDQVSWIKDLERPDYHAMNAIDENNRIVYFDNTLSIVPRYPFNTSGNDKYEWIKGRSTSDTFNIISTERIYIKENPTEEDNGYYNYSISNTIVTIANDPGNTLYLRQRSSGHPLYYPVEARGTSLYAQYDTTPTVLDQTPIIQITEGETYIYTSNISDADGDQLKVTANNLPTWLRLTSTSSNFTLTGSPTFSDLGQYDINITVVDLDAARSNAEKIPVHINYTLHVNPSEASLPTGFSFSNDTYTHTATGNTLSGEGSVDIVNDGLELTQSCVDNKMAYISIDSNGVLSTGFKNCTSDVLSETFTDPLPNKTKASIVTNNSEKMILIELPLDDDMTLGGN